MAEAAVSFAVKKLGDLLIQKAGFLRGVEEQVRWLKVELQSMRCFLKDAAEKQHNDERIRKWISDIRDVAQDAEDVIETFILKVETPTRSRGLLEKCACFPKHVYHQDKLGQEIESIRARLQDINNSRQSYGIRSLDDGVVLTRTRSYQVSRRLSPWQRDKHLVGLDEDVELLLRRAILESREGLSIATIAGMGGIGKSTLARALYKHAALANKFERRAWVVVSEEFNLREVIKALVLQVLESGEDKLKILKIMDRTTEDDLRNMLYERLNGRQYFIVLDDVWRQRDWESIKAAFPDEQDKASRLLVTSRNINVSRDARYVHAMKILDDDKSWHLFLKKALIDNTDGKCPPELEEIGRGIVEKCSGLPLAITVVGGLLREQTQSESAWKRVLKGMNSHSGTSENSVSAILELSYRDLPPHLKACFLCLGFFKEDAVIRATTLVHVWIAEGLISQEGGDDREMEEIATGYLDELINRNMVQVKDMTTNDQIKNCHLHDLLRDLSIRKAKEEINFEVLREWGINSQLSNQKSRHRAIYFSSGERLSMNAPNNKHIRTLFFHRSSYPIDINLKSFGLLRVLDFEGLGLEKLPDSIGTLIGLRYLGLRGNKLRDLPKSLGCLKNLEVLDVADIELSEVPDVVWQMDSLRHLYISYYYKPYGRLRIHALKNLQTLMFVNPDSLLLARPTEMTSLRKLGIIFIEDTNESSLWTALAMMDKLVCLKLTWWSSARHLSCLDWLVSLNGLTRLKLKGEISTLPNASNFPPNLSYLTLASTSLKEDPMRVLEKLPKLLFLKLDENAYLGEEMAISHDGFPRLKVLCLRRLYELKNIRIEQGAMPELKRLEISRCLELECLPEGVRLMGNLQELKMATTIEIASKLRDQDFSSIPYVNLIGLSENAFYFYRK